MKRHPAAENTSYARRTRNAEHSSSSTSAQNTEQLLHQPQDAADTRTGKSSQHHDDHGHSTAVDPQVSASHDHEPAPLPQQPTSYQRIQLDIHDVPEQLLAVDFKMGSLSVPADIIENEDGAVDPNASGADALEEYVVVADVGDDRAFATGLQENDVILQFKLHTTTDVFAVQHLKDLLRSTSSSEPLSGLEKVLKRYHQAGDEPLFSWHIDRDNVHESVGATIIVARPVYNFAPRTPDDIDGQDVGFDLDLNIDDSNIVQSLHRLQVQHQRSVLDEVDDELVQAYHQKPWQNGSSCAVCKVQFAKLKAKFRHHCRYCSSSVCDACSRHRWPVLDRVAHARDKSGGNRVCNRCESIRRDMVQDRASARFKVANDEKQFQKERLERHVSEIYAKIGAQHSQNRARIRANAERQISEIRASMERALENNDESCDACMEAVLGSFKANSNVRRLNKHVRALEKQFRSAEESFRDFDEMLRRTRSGR